MEKRIMSIYIIIGLMIAVVLSLIVWSLIKAPSRFKTQHEQELEDAEQIDSIREWDMKHSHHRYR